MSIKVYFEVGHTATLKSKATPEGFTHDWELFVRGYDSHNLSRYVDKVVFNLHESFPRPKRGKSEKKYKKSEYSRALIVINSLLTTICQRAAVKEPPYVLKESGYAGFELPIDIYFKGQGRDDPKKTTIVYDLNLQSNMSNHNVEKREYTFSNPSPELRRKLLDSGGVIVGAIGQLDDRSRDGVDEQRSQLISKPKLSGSDSKKHKNRSTPSDDGPKPSNTYANLFGAPIQKLSSTKVSPDQKNISSNINSSSKMSGNSNNSKQSSQKSSDKVSSKDKSDKSGKEKKDKGKYSSPVRENSGKDSSSKKAGGSGGTAFDDKRGREEKRKEKIHTKERDRSKEKAVKRPPSPKPRSRSPQRNIVGRHLEVPVPPKHGNDDKSSGSGSAKKSKKDKKDKDKDRERPGEKKDKDLKNQSKDRDDRSSSRTLEKVESKRDGGSSTPKEIAKDKSSKASFDMKPVESPYDHQITEPKHQPATEKRSEKGDKDSDRKHKHKKKDKNKDKDRGSSKERRKDKDKTSKQKDLNDNSHVATSGNKKSGANSHGLPTPPQPKKKPLGTMINELPISDNSDSDVDGSSTSPAAHTSKNSSASKPDPLDINAADHSNAHQPEIVATKISLPISSHSSSRSPVPKLESNGIKYADKASKRAAKEAKAAEKADKKRKRKDKDDQSQSGDDKRRSTPSPINGPPAHKLAKKDEPSRLHQEKNGNDISPPPSFGPDNSAPISSPSPTHHSNSNDQFTSSPPPNADTDTLLSGSEPYRSPNAFISIDYIAELKALQHKIMAVENNSDLQQVVEMIAATGCYEITSKTFDFDLCALDRPTVQRLQDFFAPTQSVL